jgi:hypothetical protein
MGSYAFEKHYRIKELAALWGLSPKTVRRLFADEIGVIRVVNHAAAKRKYATVSIPASVASRVHEKLGTAILQEMPQPAGGLRVIRLRDITRDAHPERRVIIKVIRRDSPPKRLYEGRE